MEISNCLKIYRKKLLSVLHDDVFSELMNFWKDVEEREYDYKIFVSKKCYDLYKVFIPLFNFQSFAPCVKITDTAIPIYFSNMKHKKVLIIDDVFIHGRTSLKIKQEISQEAEKVDFLVFAKNNKQRIRQDISTRKMNDLFNKFVQSYNNKYNKEDRVERFYKIGLDIEAVTPWDRFVESCLVQQDELVEGYVKCNSEYYWKRISDLIMKSLWCVNMPYVSYLPIIDIKNKGVAKKIFEQGKYLRNHRQKNFQQSFSYSVRRGSVVNSSSKIYYCHVLSMNDVFDSSKMTPMVFFDCENTSIDKKFIFKALEIIYGYREVECLKGYFNVEQNTGLVSLLKYLVFCVGHLAGRSFLQENNINKKDYEINILNAKYSFGEGISRYVNKLEDLYPVETLKSIEQCEIKNSYRGIRKNQINIEHRRALLQALKQAYSSMKNCKMEKDIDPVVDLLGKYFKDNNFLNEENLYRVNDETSIRGLKFSEIKEFLLEKGFCVEEIITGLMYHYNLGAATIDFLGDNDKSSNTIGINMYWRAGEQSYKCISNAYVMLVYYQNLYNRRFKKEIAEFLYKILVEVAENNYKYSDVPFNKKDYEKYCGIKDDVYDAFDIEEYCELDEFKYLGYIGKQLEQFILFGNITAAKENDKDKFKVHLVEFMEQHTDETLLHNCKKILWSEREKV